jgi:hypothetical protein
MLSSIKSQYDELNAFGRFFFALGIISLAVAAAMTFKFGWSMSVLHALGLGVVSIVASFLPEAAYRMGEEGHKGLAVCLALLCAPLLAVEYFSHIGYTVGQRVANVQQAGVSNVKFDDTRAALESDRANLAMWRDHLAKLQAENAWVATVSPDGLKAKITNMEGDRVYKRSKQCANVTIAESRKFCDDLAELRDRVALATQANDLTARIEATQRLVDGKTEKAAAATFESSPVVNQTAFVAKMVAWDLKPGEGIQEGSQIGIAAMLALANVLLTPICFLIAGRSRRVQDFAERHAAPIQRAMTETQRKIEDRYAEMKSAGTGPVSDRGNQNVFLRVEGKAEDALMKLAAILRNGAPVGAN